MSGKPDTLFERRRRRVRSRLARINKGRPRLSVCRSWKHIDAQSIDDVAGRTLASASTLDETLRGSKTGANKAAASAVGKLLAERAKAAGVTTVVFDRG